MSIFSLSPQQRRAWQTSVACEESGLEFTFRVSGTITPSRLVDAVRSVIARHEILHSTLVPVPGLAVPGQQVRRPEEEVPRTGGPVQVSIAAGDDSTLVTVRLDATHADRHTAAILLAEIADHYRVGTVEPAKLQYADYAGWTEDLHQEPAGALMRARWEAALTEAVNSPALFFEMTGSGARQHEVSRWVALASPGDANEASALVVWRLLLSRMTGGTEIVVAVGSNGRSEPDLAAMPGHLAALLPVKGAANEMHSVAAATRAEAERLTAARSMEAYFAWPAGDNAAELSVVRYAFDYYEWPTPVTADGAVFEMLSCRGLTDLATLLLRFVKYHDGVRLELLFDSARVSTEHAEDLLGQFESLFTAALAHPGRQLSQLCSVDEVRHAELVSQGHGPRLVTDGRYPHDSFLDWARRKPDRLAIEAHTSSVSYGELAERVKELAERLRHSGAGPERIVAALLPRGIDAVVATLACLHSGSVYAPIDPATPEARVSEMLATLAPTVLLTHEPPRAFDPARVLDPALAGTCHPVAPEAWSPHGDNAACLIHTSGSTGRPKAVVLTHDALRNRIAWTQEVTPLTPDDRYLWSAGIAFDFTLYELLAPLATGAALIVPDPALEAVPEHLVSMIVERRVTAAHFTPSMASAVLDESELDRATQLRLVFLGGEALSVDLLRKLRARVPATIVNQYGPTEGTVDVTLWTADDGPVYIGRPAANTVVHVLTDDLRVTPTGIIGEIYLGGTALSRGYHGQPALTADRYVPDPYGRSGDRLYRTGDRARRRWDGMIEFIDRRDRQVGIRGYRIELGEVEVALGRCAHVTGAAVVVAEPRTQHARLIAFVTAAGGTNQEAIRAELAGLLPGYMVPTSISVVTNLPLTSRHKVDYEALGVLATSVSDEPSAPPVGPTETALAVVWADLLSERRTSVQPIGRDDDFYRQGGHSLIALRVLAFVSRELRVTLPLPELLAASTVASLAATIERHEEAAGRTAALAETWLAAQN